MVQFRSSSSARSPSVQRTSPGCRPMRRGLRRGAEQAIQRTLQAYLRAHPDTPGSQTRVRVAAVTGGARPVVQLKSPAAWLGRASSPRKARAARRNGRLGGRPRL